MADYRVTSDASASLVTLLTARSHFASNGPVTPRWTVQTAT
jgi:hypothetical protein